ncbi:MAG: hypothetical protein ABI378_06065 [Chitinophagaceae bacterium]
MKSALAKTASVVNPATVEAPAIAVTPATAKSEKESRPRGAALLLIILQSGTTEFITNINKHFEQSKQRNS